MMQQAVVGAQRACYDSEGWTNGHGLGCAEYSALRYARPLQCATHDATCNARCNTTCNARCNMQRTMQDATLDATCNARCNMQRSMQHATHAKRTVGPLRPSLAISTRECLRVSVSTREDEPARRELRVAVAAIRNSESLVLSGTARTALSCAA